MSICYGCGSKEVFADFFDRFCQKLAKTDEKRNCKRGAEARARDLL